MSTYTVKPGDTLKSIAREALGDESMEQYLASINNIPGVPGFAGGWFYVITPGQVIETGVAEVQAKKLPRGVVVVGLLAATAAGIYYRKEIISFFKSLI